MKFLIYLLSIFLLFFSSLHISKSQVLYDISLKNCIKTAIENNITLKQTKNSIETGYLQSKQAFYNRMPNANASAGQNVNFGRSIDPGSNQFITQDIWSNNFAITSNLTIYNAGRLKYLYQASQIQINALNEDFQEQKNTIILNVVNAYIQLVFNRELVKISYLQTQATDKEIFRLHKLVQNGSIPEVQLLDMQARLMSEKNILIQNYNQLELAKINLLQLMNIATTREQLVLLDPEKLDTFNLVLHDTLTSKDSISNDYVFAQPLIKSGRYRLEASEKNLKAAQSLLYPRISLAAGVSSLYSNARKQIVGLNDQGNRVVGFLTSDPTQTVSQPILIPISKTIPFSTQVGENAAANVGISIIIPIFNNYQARINLAQNKIQLENQKLALLKAEQTIRQRMEIARINLNNAIIRKKATEAALKSTLESYRIAERRFQNGASTQLEFNILAINYYRATSEDTQAKYDLILKKKIVDFYENNGIDF